MIVRRISAVEQLTGTDKTQQTTTYVVRMQTQLRCSSRIVQLLIGCAVTKEDVDCIRDDWLTDNVSHEILKYIVVMNWIAKLVLQAIAFWEEYV